MYVAVIIKVKFLTMLLKFEKFVSFFKCQYFTIYIYLFIYTNNCTVIRYGDIQTHVLPPTCLSFSAVF